MLTKLNRTLMIEIRGRQILLRKWIFLQKNTSQQRAEREECTKNMPKMLTSPNVSNWQSVIGPQNLPPHRALSNRNKNFCKIINYGANIWNTDICTVVVRPAWAYSKGWKSRSHLDSGKATAKGKGVRGDAESEGSQRQTSGLMDKNLI